MPAPSFPNWRHPWLRARAQPGCALPRQNRGYVSATLKDTRHHPVQTLLPELTAALSPSPLEEELEQFPRNRREFLVCPLGAADLIPQNPPLLRASGETEPVLWEESSLSLRRSRVLSLLQDRGENKCRWVATDEAASVSFLVLTLSRRKLNWLPGVNCTRIGFLRTYPCP